MSIREPISDRCPGQPCSARLRPDPTGVVLNHMDGSPLVLSGPSSRRPARTPSATSGSGRGP